MVLWSIALALAIPPPPADAMPEWLAGCWQAPLGAGVLTETWLGPVDGVMVGAALGPGKPGAPTWEHLRIQRIDGRLTLVASPGGQPTTAFVASATFDDVAVFENPKHDFPQRITYTRKDAGLTAVVEARDGDAWKGFTLQFTRCPAR